MGRRVPQEFLEELRARLKHFDQTGDLGESDTVEDIKRHLRARIVEAEADVARLADPAADTPKRP